MNYALIENGQVVNLIWLYPGNESDFAAAVPCGDVPVCIGDTYDGSQFLREGQRVLTPLEEAQNIIAELDAALLEVQYQMLIGGFDE